MKKTNAVRLLDNLKIEYELLIYEVDEEELGAKHVAEELGIPLEQILKTLVLRGDRHGVVVCCVPGEGELDLKRLARLIGEKKIDLVPARDVLALTGYLRGGCSPLAMKKKYPTFVESSALNRDFVVVSAGVRGMQIKLTPESLVAATGAKAAELILR